MRNDDYNDANLSNGRIEPQLNSSATHSSTDLESYLAAANLSNKGRSNKAIGFLSVLTIAIACSAAAFGWWSFERMQLLEQQLIATQDSFSKVSEEASGRINAITGKVSVTESNVLSGTDALKIRLDTLEKSVVETQKKQQSSLAEHASKLTLLSSQLATLAERSSSLDDTLAKQGAQLAQHEKTSKEALTTLRSELSKNFDTELVALNSELKQTLDAALKAQNTALTKSIDKQYENLQNLEKSSSSSEQLAKFEDMNTRLQTITADLAILQKGSKKDTPSQSDLTRLQQDILILRTEVENRPAPVAAAPAKSSGPSIAEFDAYRAQTHRTISALQEQVRNLQKNTR